MTDNRKTTVPGASVGADAVQSSHKTSTNIITNSDKQINLQAAKKSNNFGLNTVSMTELYDTVYPPRRPIVNDLLYSGTYLFVGAPKVGKSFFMGQLAYHVAMGLPLWEYEVHQGTVLYLALEDDYARLQRRLSRMFGVEETSNLYFATQAKSVSEGLDQQLEGFIREHPDVRLIIIDTLQKVREIGGDRYSYASDYEIVTKLKSFSDRYGICLLVVHHTRKMEAEDSFDMISGTNGLLGAADGAFIMQKKRRTDNTALLEHRGTRPAGSRVDVGVQSGTLRVGVSGGRNGTLEAAARPASGSGGKGAHPGTAGVERYAHGTAGTAVGCRHTGKPPDPEAECECRQALQRLWDSVREQAHP